MSHYEKCIIFPPIPCVQGFTIESETNKRQTKIQHTHTEDLGLHQISLMSL